MASEGTAGHAPPARDDLFGLSPEEVVAADRRHVWHPFTQEAVYQSEEPVVIAAAEGRRLFDVHGRPYWDGVSSIWLNVHGHRVPELDEAVRRQLERFSHATLLGQGSAPAAVLAQRLAAVAPPGLTRVFFSDSGAEAVEVGIKMAIQYWANRAGHPTPRTRILGFTGGYHGDTLGAVGPTPDEVFHWPFRDLLPDHPRAPYPYCYRCPLGEAPDRCATACLVEVDRILADQGERVAAVIVEPVQGAGGIIPAPPGFLRGLREICDRRNTLLIVDEVATGFGRTGSLFACQAEGVTPDILCLGKGLTGGYLPVAATLATERIYEAFLGDATSARALYHGHSYAGNALGCAVAIANLDLMASTRLVEGVPAKAALVAQRLAPLRDHPYVGDVRQRGLMLGIELVADRASRRPFRREQQAGWAVARQARERGLLIRPLGNVVVFMPPLGSTAEELEEMTAILLAALAAATPALAAMAREVGP
ncbi:MAG: adenosylmethionine--8-amino-7-oxononanoate transaminase [Clostridia bacterium]|nr:adenosylmethionine--8-amino-7-oxononanoate transaminase [Clostridia bacterium]